MPVVSVSQETYYLSSRCPCLKQSIFINLSIPRAILPTKFVTRGTFLENITSGGISPSYWAQRIFSACRQRSINRPTGEDLTPNCQGRISSTTLVKNLSVQFIPSVLNLVADLLSEVDIHIFILPARFVH
jgi:hypothetical protein